MQRSQIGGAMGVASQHLQKNQHEIVAKNKAHNEVATDLQKEKEHNHMLQRLLEKALAEIQNYVNRFGSYVQRDEDDVEALKEGSHIRADFTFKKLEPLLMSYEETIAESKHMVEVYRQDVQSLEQLSKKYVEENNTLRTELERKCQTLLNIYQNGNPNDSVANIYKRIQKDDLQEKVTQLTEENSVLTGKFKEVSGKLKEKERDVQVLGDQVNKLTLKGDDDQKQIADLKEQLAGLKQFQEQATTETTTSLKKNSSLQTKVAMLEQENQKLTKNLKMQNDVAKQLQKDLDSTSSELQTQIGKLESENQQKERQIKELSGEKIKLTKENQQVLEELKQLRTNYYENEQDSKKLRTKFDEQERKLNLAVSKEENLMKTQQKLNDNENQLIQERDQLTSKNRQLEKTVNNMESQHQIQLEQLRGEKDKILDQIRSKSKQQLDERDNKIEDLEFQIQQNTIQIDRLQKEQYKFKQEKDDIGHLVKTEKFRLENENEYLKKKNHELDEQIQRREQFFDDKLSGYKIDKEQLELQNNNLQHLVNELKNANEQLRKKANNAEVQNFELKDKVTSMTRSQMQGSNSKAMRLQMGN